MLSSFLEKVHQGKILPTDTGGNRYVENFYYLLFFKQMDINCVNVWAG